MNSIDKINTDYQAISNFLLKSDDISLLNDFNDYFR